MENDELRSTTKTKERDMSERKLANYGLGEAANRALAELEKLLREHDAGLLSSMLQLKPEDCREVMEICDGGVASFEKASRGVAPFQKVAVGIAYTVNALREWRVSGPLSASDDVKGESEK
jgi:hypothetical protein